MRRTFGAASALLAAIAVCGLTETASAQNRLRRSIDGPITTEAVTRSLIVVADAGEAENAGDPGAPTELSLMLSIEFGFDSAQLTLPARRDLDTVATALNHPELAGAQLTLEGHTDAVGEAGYNLRLSQRRAEVAVAYLLQRGVAGHRLRAAGFGEYRLLPAYAPTDDRQRRVEMVRQFER